MKPNSLKDLATRALRGSRDTLPLYRVDLHGQPSLIARMHLLHPQGVSMEFLAPFGWPLDADMRGGRFDGMPYPLQDMRPQGFLGRHLARYYAPLLQVSENPNDWSDDDALHAMSLVGAEAPGDLIVGEHACEQWREHLRQVAAGRTSRGVADDDVPHAFPALARLILTEGIPGSSAGGEFPKFTTLRLLPDGSQQHVLVKFTGDDDSPATRRWADLLVCEHLAGRVLASELGVPAATSRVHAHAGRTFLEVDRFDRHGGLGRSPLVSWFALNATFVGIVGQPWHDALRSLHCDGWIDAHDLTLVERTWRFGQLIANNDMHDGNLSFRPRTRDDGTVSFDLAPVYDMLPMSLAPRRDGRLPVAIRRPSLPVGGDAPSSRAVIAAARVFWRLAADDDRISHEFRGLCALHHQALLALS
ncbi:type II toxin-antitoxin system HipA family toxin YjjJ [Mitsuaria sp. GD03876]|uniref:type II toxin-antitoxin system HipA family toxin YjjJ n=1 Tax=Mitsuaria sp. GD03876 TaxID=2975399 RepID=UPI002449F655|nr:type II toxin-antitoxin system HipA family toxin YjjJ [Mitsuaria sp. GD03876]MDH0864007.1 type II toxin-antitoxin system HipA family toxin YjjJ [Mitsuaria sp. GD03876]